MSLRQYLASVTHREHRLYVAFLELDMEVPDRADHYSMLIAQAVRTLVWIKGGCKGEAPTLDDCRLRRRTKERKMTAEEATALSKAAWGQRLGIQASKLSGT